MKVLKRDDRHQRVSIGEEHEIAAEAAGVRVSVWQSPAEDWVTIHVDPVNEGWINRLDVREIAAHQGQVRIRVAGRRES